MLRFHPPLWEKLDAAHALPLGLADILRVDEATELPQGIRLFGAIDRAATGSYHLRPFGRPIIEGYFGGQFARELEEQGDGAFARFAIEQIAALLGNDLRRRLHPLTESAWGRDPFARGAYSYAKIGQADRRAVLAAPVNRRLGHALADDAVCRIDPKLRAIDAAPPIAAGRKTALGCSRIGQYPKAQREAPTRPAKRRHIAGRVLRHLPED